MEKIPTTHEDLIVRHAKLCPVLTRSAAAPPHPPHRRGPRGAAPLLAACSRLEPLAVCSQHDVQLDYYGKRLATCSSDRTVKVYDVMEGGERKQVADLKGCASLARAACAMCTPSERAQTGPCKACAAGPCWPLSADRATPPRSQARRAGLAGGLGAPEVRHPAGDLLVPRAPLRC